MFMLTVYPLQFMFCAQYFVNFLSFAAQLYSTVLRDLDLRYPIQKNVSPAFVSALVNVGQSLRFMSMLSLTHSAVVPK